DSVFPYVAIVAPQPYLDGERGGNFVLVGSNQPIIADDIELLVANDEQVLTGDTARAWFAGATILIDEFAPVDQWISRP
ncbi:MAG: spermidine synthase, partial [Proteobacteria bacterium]|nr:spermidine synthase [Pseudomonadota bacterium]